MRKSKPAKRARHEAAGVKPDAPRCGLCGRRGKLTTCVGSGTIISRSEDGYSLGPDGYRCDACTGKALAKRVAKRTARS